MMSTVVRRRRAFAMVLVAFLTVIPSYSLAADVPAYFVTAFNLYQTIEQVGSMLREAANQAAEAGDQVMKNRLEQAAAEVALLLPKLEKVLKGVEKAGNEVVNNAARELAEQLSALRRDSSTIGTYASTRLNSTLALASQAADESIFTNVDPVVLAILPSRIDATNVGRRIRIMGYLPGVPNKDISVTVSGQPVKVARSSGNSLTFDLPKSIKLAEGVPLKVRVLIQKGGILGLFRKDFSIEDQIVVGKTAPMTCNVSTYLENPAYLSLVAAVQPSTSIMATTQGGQNRPNESRKLLAEDLFVETMGDDAKNYVLSSVIVNKHGLKPSLYGGCGGQGPSASAEVQNQGKSVSVELHAPYLKKRVSGGMFHTRYCDAGGTKAVAQLKPEFKAAKASAEYLTVQKSESFSVPSYSGLEVPYSLPAGKDWAIHVKCEYSDGPEKWQTRTMVLRPKDEDESGRGVALRLAENKLLIEPIDPIRFDDDLR